MQITRSFRTSESPEVTRRAVSAYLVGAGFRQVGDDPFLTYERGSAKGSMFSFSPKKWQTKAAVQVTSPSGEGEEKAVFVCLDVNTTGQMVLKREINVFEKELDGLVAAVSGSLAAPVVAGQMPVLQQIATDQETVRLENQMKSGANWFYWIAGVSLVNTVMSLLGARYSFIMGLGIAQLVDGIVYGLSQNVAEHVALVAKIVGLIVNLAFATLFAVFGVLARQKRKWPFIVGIVLYVLDALLFIWVGDWLSFLFHLIALYGLWVGLKARNRLAAASTGG